MNIAYEDTTVPNSVSGLVSHWLVSAKRGNTNALRRLFAAAGCDLSTPVGRALRDWVTRAVPERLPYLLALEHVERSPTRPE